MYSTMEGAKKFAKNLKLLLDGSGIVFSLNRCQSATAVAGSFRNWHDLSQSLKNSSRPVDPDEFRRRLIGALPQPCWIPVVLWLDEGCHPEKSGDGMTHNYYRAVAPYVFSSSVIHRSRSALLRPGSGPGQRLRESLVVSLLLGGRGEIRLLPRLEPDTLALVVRGDLPGLFGPDALHPRFKKDFASLVAAGIFEYKDCVLRVLPADREEVAAHVSKGLADRARYFSSVGQDEAIEALAVALSASGIEKATRLAETVVAVFSEGVREPVPAKISSLYLTRKRGIDAGKIVQWASARPDWADRLKSSLQDLAQIEKTLDAMGDAIEAVGDAGRCYEQSLV